MFQAEKGVNAIPGYTGFVPSQDYDQDMLQVQGNRNHIPNYAGFVPGIKAENLFGKTFGKITLLSSTHQHHRGSDLPPDLRYTSTIQDAFCDQRQQKAQDKDLYGKLDPETSKALAYTLSNLTHTDDPKDIPRRGNYRDLKSKLVDKDRKSELTYEDALQKLKSQS